MKHWKMFTLFLIVPLAAFAGGQAEDSAQTAEDTVELNLWSWRTEDVAEYEQFLSEFESDNPGVQVNFRAIQNTEYNSVLATALEGGQGPDVMHLRAYGGLQRYTEFLEPIGDKIDGLDGFSDSAIASATGVDDDRVYGVPFATQVLGVYYNRSMFEEHGVSEPETWEEFIDVMDTLQSEGVTPLANAGQAGWMLEILFGAVGPNFYGGNEFFQEVTAGETDFTDPRFVEALEQVQTLRDYMPPGYMGIDYPSMQANFYTEQSAMFVGGSFEAAFFQDQNPDLDIGVFAVPAPEGMDTRYVGTWADGSFGMNADTEHPEEALALMEFLASQEFGNMFTNTLAQISPIPGVQANSSEVPVLAQFIDAANTFSTTPYIMLVGFRWDQPDGSSLLQNGLQGLLQGDMTAEEVAQEVQTGIASWYEPFQD